MRIRSTGPAPLPAPSTAARPSAARNVVVAKSTALDTFSAKAATRPEPLPKGRPLSEYDGALQGNDGRYYPVGTDPASVRGYAPKGRPANGTAIFINGIGNNNPAQQAQQFADATGCEVVPLYNATQGFWKDATQVLEDSIDRGENAAVNSLVQLISTKLAAGEPVRLVAHSQGALITSRALQDVKDQLIAKGMTPAQAEQTLAKVQVETFGGAASAYPDGPRYTHYVNRFDPVTLFSGWFAGSSNAGNHPGKGAKVVAFWDWSWKPSTHDPATYLKHYQAPPAATAAA